MTTLSGRVALITGAGSGLGRATARRLSRGGAHVVVTDLVEESAAETVRLIEQDGGRASCRSLDVADSDSARQVVAATADEFGSAFDILINNAGTDRGAGLLDLTDEHWNSVIAVNQSGPLFMTREFLRATRDRPYDAPPADVVNVVSISAITVGTEAAAYNSSKAALAMLTRIMQREAHEYRWPVRI